MSLSDEEKLEIIQQRMAENKQVQADLEKKWKEMYQEWHALWILCDPNKMRKWTG